MKPFSVVALLLSAWIAHAHHDHARSSVSYTPLSEDHGDREFGGLKHWRSTRKTSTPVNVTHGDHRYYTSRFYPPSDQADMMWFELSDMIGSGVVQVDNLTQIEISNLHRYVQRVNIKFEFPYYGHIVNTAYVTTGGFLFVGTFAHPELIALTQNISPLQADFNPGLNNTARVLVYSTDKRFTVQWDEVHNHDHVNDGPFTFQLTLFPSGVIHFAYREIPLVVSELNNDDHPVSVGISDALYIDTIRNQRRVRLVYEYHRVDLNASDDLAMSAYVITPLKNCVMAKDCETCVQISNETDFECGWCSSISRCSDGIDRFTQDWIRNSCPNNAISSCPTIPSLTSPSPSLSPSPSSIVNNYQSQSSSQSSIVNSYQSMSPTPSPSPSQSQSSIVNHESLRSSSFRVVLSMSSRAHSPYLASSSSSSSPSPSSPPTRPTTPPIIITGPIAPISQGLSAGVLAGVVVVVLVITGVLLIGVIVISLLVHGYRNPHSRTGMFMIQNRPSALMSKMKKGSVPSSAMYEMGGGDKVILED